MAVVVPAISEIFRGAGLKILVFRRGLVGALDGANQSGVPDVNGAVVFDERFLGKPLVFCGT